jgi:Leucine-rich repeat (LRR) protein
MEATEVAQVAIELPRKRRRFLPRISVRLLMVMVLLIGGALGWEMHRVKVQRDAVAALEKARFSVDYDWAWADLSSNGRSSPFPRWLVKSLGNDFFGDVVSVSGRSGGQVDDELMAHIGRLKQIQDLSFHDTSGVTDDRLSYLKPLDRLEDLRLIRTEIQGPGLRHLEGLKQLRTLILDDIPLNDQTMAHFAPLVSLRYLRTTNCKDVGDVGLAHLRSLVNMQTLHLDNGSRITSKGLNALQGMSQLFWLEITFSQIDSLDSLNPLRELTHVRLHKNQLKDAGLEALANQKNLTRLYLSFEKIGDHSLKTIGKIKTLEHLELASTEITDSGMIHLADLPRLTNLDLSKTRIGDDGIAHLVGLSSLQVLTLENTEVTDTGLVSLSGLSGCRGIDLKGSKVTPNGLNWLRSQLPGTKIN